MITTPVRDPATAAPAASSAGAPGRFTTAGADHGPDGPAAGPSLRDVVRAGEYVVDPDAVAAAMIDRLLAGRAIRDRRGD
jgi:hypothetical protein